MRKDFDTIEKQEITAFDIITYGLLFLASMNINNMFFSIIAILLCILFITNKVTFPKNSWAIYAFCFSFMIFYYYNKDYRLNDLLKAFSYGMCFSIGDIILRRKKDKVKVATNLLLLVAFGFCIHGCLNFFINYQEYGWNPASRNMPDVWTGKPMSATLHSAIFCLFVGVLYYCLFIEKRKHIAFLAGVGTVIMILFNMMSASRTVFVLLAITFMVSFVGHIFLKKAVQKKHMVLMLLILIAYLAFLNNTFNVRTFYEESALGLRMKYTDNIQEDSRFLIHKVYLVGMYYYPFGGRNIKRIIGVYAHDLFLDLYDMAGVIPTAFLFVFVVKMLFLLFRILKEESIDIGFKILYLSVNSAMIFQFFVEPILEGIPWLLAIYCLINGMGTRVYMSVQQEKKAERGL